MMGDHGDMMYNIVQPSMAGHFGHQILVSHPMLVSPVRNVASLHTNGVMMSQLESFLAQSCPNVWPNNMYI